MVVGGRILRVTRSTIRRVVQRCDAQDEDGRNNVVGGVVLGLAGLSMLSYRYRPLVGRPGPAFDVIAMHPC